MNIVDAESGIIHRDQTFDGWIVRESKGYFPLGLTATDTVLDLGGHIGAFASRAMLEQPGVKLTALEAEKSNFDVLQQNAEKFGFDAEYGAIVADELAGTMITVYVNQLKNNATHSIIPVRGRAEQQVPGVGFSAVLDLLEPTVIKCDIEGAEYLLPWNKLAQYPNVRKVVMELHLTKRGHRELAASYDAMFHNMGFATTRAPKIGEKNWTTLAVWTK